VTGNLFGRDLGQRQPGLPQPRRPNARLFVLRLTWASPTA